MGGLATRNPDTLRFSPVTRRALHSHSVTDAQLLQKYITEIYQSLKPLYFISNVIYKIADGDGMVALAISNVSR